MGKIFLTSVLLGMVLFCYGQQNNPVSLKFSLKETSDRKYELHIVVNIAPTWHIYSQHNLAGDLSVPTSIVVVENPLVTLQGNPREIGKLIQVHEEALGVDLKYYENRVDFVQVLTVKTDGKTKLSGTIVFMACTETRCLPPESRSFNIVIQ